MTRAQAIIRSYLGVLAFASLVFIAAGKLLYWQGLLYVGLALIGTTLNHLLIPPGSGLTVDRAARAHEGQAWDKRVLGAIFLASLAMFVVAGLDSGRFGWTGKLPPWVVGVGVPLMLLGQILFAFAKRENRFFTSTVRLQPERGHQVCDTGLYCQVRHPGYLGMLLSLLAFPLILQSWWAFIPAAMGAVLLIIRTQLEDRFLQANLPGYPEFARRVRWRLFPGLF